jgi:hypothetical protein
MCDRGDKNIHTPRRRLMPVKIVLAGENGDKPEVGEKSFRMKV